MTFKPVNPAVDFPQLEKKLLEHWYADGIVEKYLHKNDKSKTKFSFLDGPITANNPMGVHHAWGRTYKDLWQRYHTMKGDAGRYQNGFDCQGLWVEVEVEKELGFKSKKDIEAYGVDKFVEKCKERVRKYSAIQTEQSKRLGYFMDWPNSYFTMSDTNNYTIWNFLKTCHEKGWVYKGHDSVPWCPRCETAISQHEILTEDYKELVHESVFIQFPLVKEPNTYLLVWTTTPWTIIANIAVAVDKKIKYSLVQTGLNKFWLAAGAVERVMAGREYKILRTVLGQKLIGLKYSGPFDHLPAVSAITSHELFHTVVATDDRIMPISESEGTGMVHTAVSAGEEDFKLGQKLKLPMVPVIADNADYLPDLGNFTGQNAKKHPEIILDYLKDHHYCFSTLMYKHRYPACWRCKTELVWKVADEWYIAMDTPDTSGKTYRQQMIATAKKINWLPDFGKARELDWLKNMHDWLISKKNRYWGLALPIYECPVCHTFEVIGSALELKNRSVSGWDKFAGHSPHKPWVDEVKISCQKCGAIVSRIGDVGNPWLDAGIVSISTLSREWFPADFITESFPGQFKNWFYSLIAMSTVLRNSPPTKTILGYASLLDEKAQAMHKSSGNMIEFSEGADKIGADVMRWMFAQQNPENNLLFGYQKADETRRQFHLILWNIYNFFVSNANADGFTGLPEKLGPVTNVLDTWILARLNQVVNMVTNSLDKYDSATAGNFLAAFVSDFSTWYIRRSRDRVGPVVLNSSDKTFCYTTIFTCLTTLSRLLAPFTPFISDEIYTNMTGQLSVHLSDWPKTPQNNSSDKKLFSNMILVRKIVELGLAHRKESRIKVRQPLRSISIFAPQLQPESAFCKLILDELNIKNLVWNKGSELSITLDLHLDSELIAEGQLRNLIREVQEARKSAGVSINQKIILTAPLPANPALVSELKLKTLSSEVRSGEKISIIPI
jgi:isoleucyl-tRNA synthetase